MPNEGCSNTHELLFPSNCDYGQLTSKVIATGNGNINNGQGPTDYGDTCPEGSHTTFYYGQDGNLFIKPLILAKLLKSPHDTRYKTDYFPRGGKNAGTAKPPIYVHTVDDEQDITIKFPAGYITPSDRNKYYLEVVLVTVPRNGQHYIHTNKFQLNHTDANILDQNIFFIPLTEEHFKNGEIKVKLVIVKTTMNDLKNISSLPLFNGETPLDWAASCESVDDLKHTYELNSMMIAFSLGYKNSDDQFIRFPNTTVISNEIIEKEKPKPSDTITCPNCTHSFSIKEEREKVRKRSASLSDLPTTKRSSSYKNSEN